MQTKNRFLFVTANEHERDAFEKKFLCEGEAQYIESKDYYMGMFGKYPAAYIHLDEQGATAPETTLLVNKLVANLNPAGVVIVGIAFGSNDGTDKSEYNFKAYEEKQKIGDILVSYKILPYDSRKELEGKTEYKDDPREVGFRLRNAFRSHRDWVYYLPDSECSKVHVGAILTGSALINDYEFRTKLLRDFCEHKPIGGEMEAQGIYSLCRFNGVSEWIIVKSICDWAYNKGASSKNDDQILAANAAVDYCSHVFSHNGIFDNFLSKAVIREKTASPQLGAFYMSGNTAQNMQFIQNATFQGGNFFGNFKDNPGKGEYRE